MEVVARNSLTFDIHLIEDIILNLGDEFDIRIEWNESTGFYAVTLGLIGTVVGGLLGGRVGAAVGAGVGTISGVGVSNIIAIRELWPTIKETLTELYYIVYNFLRNLNPEDYIRAIELLSSTRTKTQLALNIIEFIGQKFITYANITAQ